MEMIEPYIGQWLHYLWQVSWQVVVLVVFVWMFEHLMGKSSSIFRFLLWCIVLLRIVLPLNLIVPGLERLFPVSVGEMARQTGATIIIPLQTMLSFPVQNP